MKNTTSSLSILVFMLLGFSYAHANTVFEVYLEDGTERFGELEFPTGVQSQFPFGMNKNCTTGPPDDDFPSCQSVMFRPDPSFFSGINDSDTDLTETLISDPVAFWFIGDTGSLNLNITGFDHDFGLVITSGDSDFQYVEVYFDTRNFYPEPNVCAAAQTELLGFTDCFDGSDEDRLQDTAEFRLVVHSHATPVPTLTILAQLALVLLIAGLGILGIRKRSYKLV